MMTRYVEALDSPKHESGDVFVFMAGGITGCPNWQQELVELLSGVDGLVLVNPRRAEFPIGDPNAALEQIAWEHDHLRMVDAILFWFPCETLCPIVLYELGAWSMTDKPLWVGTHPDYARRCDVEIQTQLTRPDVQVVYSLEALAEQIKCAEFRAGGGRNMRVLCVDDPKVCGTKRVWLNDKEVTSDTWRALVPNHPGVTGLGWVDMFEKDAGGHIFATKEGEPPTIYRSHGLVRWKERLSAT